MEERVDKTLYNIQEFTKTPGYKTYDYKQDVLYVLVCQIKVWQATAPDWFTIPDKCTIITEVEEIEINETYKELINGAVVRLPKGSVVNETINKKKIDDDVKTGNKTSQEAETKLSASSRMGELLTVDDMVNSDDEHTLMVDSNKGDTGLAPASDNQLRVASVNDFQIGNRIEINIGYVYQEQGQEDTITEKLQKVKNGEHITELYPIFTGFITGCSISSPLEIECENMASLLKKVSSRKGLYKGSYGVNDFLASDGKFKLLDGTGIVLSKKSQEANIKLSNFEISDGLSVYEMIRSWSQGNLYSMMSRNGREIKIGNHSLSDTDWQDDKQRIDYSDDKSTMYIQSDWDVVSDNLEVTKVEKEFLLVRAKAQVRDAKSSDKNTKKGAVVLVGKVNGEWHVDKRDWRVGKAQKKKRGQGGRPEVISKFDLKKYFIVEYSPREGIETIDDLIDSAKTFWTNWSSNGISGSLTLFGDLRIHPTQIIGYVNTWSPEKNGHYFVESVKTSFGINGYRQTIKIPRKISDFTKVIRTI